MSRKRLDSTEDDACLAMQDDPISTPNVGHPVQHLRDASDRMQVGVEGLFRIRAPLCNDEHEGRRPSLGLVHGRARRRAAQVEWGDHPGEQDAVSDREDWKLGDATHDHRSF